MLRRLYSSLPSSSSSSGRLKSATSSGSSSIGGSSSSPTGASTRTRGRSKPSRHAYLLRSLRSPAPSASASLSANRWSALAVTPTPTPATPPTGAKPLIGKGRRHRAALRAFLSPSSIYNHPTAKDYTFRPMLIYPAQMILHKALLPPHMPIPVHFGMSAYTRPPRQSSTTTSSSSSSSIAAAATGEPESGFSLGPFAPRLPPSPAPELSVRGSSALADHVTVTSTLSHPSLIHHLGTPFWDNIPSPSEYAGFGKSDKHDPDAHLGRIFAEASVWNTLSAGKRWEETLAKLGGGSSSSSSSPSLVKEEEMELSTSEEEARLVRGEKEMRVAVDGVNALLAKIGLGDKDDTSVEDLGVGMDSVRRKRKKKISKHKYKKRRKATRAQRKRLGK